MADQNRSCIVFGAGALGLGFLGPELHRQYRMIFVDIPQKAGLIGALRAGRSYRMNESGPALNVQEIDNVDALDVAADAARLERELAGATLIFTAVGEPNLGKVAPLVARAARAVPAGRRLRVLCCENGIHIAEKMRGHLRAALGGELPDTVRVGDTVMGRMCQWVEHPQNPWTALAPGVDVAVVGEPFFGMPVEAHALEGLESPGEAFQVCSPARFAALEDLKMFAHNGLHAFLACLGALRGYELFCQLSADAEIMALARRLLADEIGPALLTRHAEGLDRNEYRNYATTIVRRILCPGLRDTIGRGVRGALRKLAPWERFISGVRCVKECGGSPVLYSRGVAAAARMAVRLGETGGPLDTILAETCGLDPRSEADLIDLIHEGDRWLDREFAGGR